MTTAVKSDSPVENTVLFTVTVRVFQRDGHWMARALETGIIGYGDTRKEAEAAAGAANEAIVKRWKTQGNVALEKFLTSHGIKYSLNGQWGSEPVGEAWSLAA